MNYECPQCSADFDEPTSRCPKCGSASIAPVVNHDARAAIVRNSILESNRVSVPLPTIEIPTRAAIRADLQRKTQAAVQAAQPVEKQEHGCISATPVICREAGIEFPTIKAAAKWLRSRTTLRSMEKGIRYSIHHGGRYAGYIWQSPNFQKMPIKKKKTVEVIDRQSGAVYDSIKEAAISSGIHRYHVTESISKPANLAKNPRFVALSKRFVL